MKSTVQVVIAVLCLSAAHSDQGVENFLLKKQDQESAIRASRAKTFINRWMTQKLDHFNHSETRTWQMRYLSEDQYFAPEGPMFIQLGGKSKISSNFLRKGHMLDMTMEHSGHLFYLEHRYYGKSRPTVDLSTSNLSHLNVRQALADIHDFIVQTKIKIPALANSSVILAGHGYAGSMVVWFKRLYPNMVSGGWASSAPLIATLDFDESKEVVGNVIRMLGSSQCYNRIQNGIFELQNMFKTNRAHEALSLLRVCNAHTFNHTNSMELWSLFGTIAKVLTKYIQELNEEDMSDTCDSLMPEESDVSAVLKIFFHGYEVPVCWQPRYQDTIDSLSDINNFVSQRQWFYQACSEFGWFETSGSPNQPFGTQFPIDYFTTLCADIFGEQYNSSYIENNIKDTNDFLRVFPYAVNVYITYGEYDPWKRLAPYLGINIIGGAQVTNLNSISSVDSREMKASKQTIAEYVRTWVVQPTSKVPSA